jgi:hypothetical protein
LSPGSSLTAVELPAGAPPLLRRAARRSHSPSIHRHQSVAGEPNRRPHLLVCVAKRYLTAGEPVPAVGPEGDEPRVDL